jgi:Reverse transcriptase (RNA-dependent DNA polymerase)
MYEDNIDNVTPEMQDGYVGAEVNLPFQGTIRAGKVKHRARNEEGELEGVANATPILDTRAYQVEFNDGELAAYSANVIAENMYAQCDKFGNQYRLMEELINHRTDGKAVKIADQFTTIRGQQHMQKTTIGWSICVQWKNSGTSWERLSDLKESNPLKVAEYAVGQGIDHEPAFSWWVPHVLKNRERIISAVNKHYHKRTHKFGIEVPKSVADVVRLNQEKGNTLWMDAVALEMAAVKVSFKLLDDGDDAPVGYQQIKCHLIFDVKLDGFCRKAQMVAGGHVTEVPAVMTYASMVSRESVRIALTLAALNDLEVKASDIMNAYLTSPCEEKIWTVLGPEFGSDAGRKAILVRALYGLKRAGASFSRHLADCMQMLGYKSCKANPDVWMKAMVRPDNGFEYYAYILLYVDDMLCIHHDAESAIRQLDKYFPMKAGSISLKAGSIGNPDIYLGMKLQKVELENGVHACGAQR